MERAPGRPPPAGAPGHAADGRRRGERGDGQRDPAARGRRRAEVPGRGLRAHRGRGHVEVARHGRQRRRRHPGPGARRGDGARRPAWRPRRLRPGPVPAARRAGPRRAPGDGRSRARPAPVPRATAPDAVGGSARVAADARGGLRTRWPVRSGWQHAWWRRRLAGSASRGVKNVAHVHRRIRRDRGGLLGRHAGQAPRRGDRGRRDRRGRVRADPRDLRQGRAPAWPTPSSRPRSAAAPSRPWPGSRSRTACCGEWCPETRRRTASIASPSRRRPH